MLLALGSAAERYVVFEKVVENVVWLRPQVSLDGWS
jgi:hypothetical protein